MSGLKLIIPKESWNAYDRNAESETVASDDTGSGASSASFSSPKTPTKCKTKVSGFHFGGPKRKQWGVMQNAITFEQPCLQLTCANCWRWYAHLMRIEYRNASGIHSDPQMVHRPTPEPLSPEVDPKLLDGSWADARQKSGVDEDHDAAAMDDNDNQTRPPVGRFSNQIQDMGTTHQHAFAHFTGHPPSADDGKYTITVPTPLISHVVAGASAKTITTPRKSHIARLVFTTKDGKQRYKCLVEEVVNRERISQHDRRKRKRLIAGVEERRALGGSKLPLEMSMGRSGRSPGVGKLVLRSEMGRAASRDVVTRYDVRGL